MIVYAHSNSPRLEYIANFIAGVLGADGVSVTSSIQSFISYDGPRINYSEKKITEQECWLQPHPLLFENGISVQDPLCFEWEGQKAFFGTDAGDWPFDIFAASFYLLSRYEEYLPHQKDMYGRYAFENSIAWREGFLSIPLVNVWLRSFGEKLKKLFPSASWQPQHFIFLPTYDIDIAWSYRQKGWWRSAAGLIQSVLKRDLNAAGQRIRVLNGKEKDPFDTYGWLNHLHETLNIKPYYFFLVADPRGRYDKNISPRNKQMQALIRDHVIRYPVGIHPSWISGDDESLLKKEMGTMAWLTGNPVTASRQHYIRFNLPDGYRRLLGQGIRFDFSMGYGSINGFRASVAVPFYWYDILQEAQTELMLFPFCFMDANSFYEQRFTPAQAFEEMRAYYHAVRTVQGCLITIWHNSILGTDKDFAGWREVYDQFVKEVMA